MPPFLRVKSGDYIIMKVSAQVAKKEVDNWWMGHIIFCKGGARDPRANTMFHASNVDNGGIHWVNADEVIHIVCTD
ncbi:DUF3104 domain-containing protein [Synechococcus sp. UW140]|uniref:DUF3104 domain-containing protein n=1 Tax=Synechococcus sp. UW140 TaxID=368503 RepID=UPI00210F47EA|nr:DUF3104 domain-containing protein [Synechococcus sp. UW140]